MQKELIACYEVTIQAVGLKNSISGLNVVDFISKPIKIYCDNALVVFISKITRDPAARTIYSNQISCSQGNINKGQIVIARVNKGAMIANLLSMV